MLKSKLSDSTKELAFQNDEKETRATELSIANKELIFQNDENEKRAAELSIAYKELVFQNKEKGKRAAELSIASKELISQNKEKDKRAAELSITIKELVFQNKEKDKRAAELSIANKELVFQNEEKDKRAAELMLVRSFIEVKLDPIVTISATGKILEANEASLKVTGITREKLIGTDFYTYFTEPQRAQECYQQVFEKGFVTDYPLTIKHKNGTLTDVLYNASVYKDDKGNALVVFAAARDVTSQKQASQYARSLIEASLDPLVTINANGKITDVNEASIKVTGVEREKLIDTDFSNYFTEPQKAQEGYQQVFEKGFVADYPLTIKHKNGNLTDVLYNASVYKNDKGDVLGVFAAARDVTGAKETQEKLQASEERIRLATKASGVGVWEWNVITNKVRWDAQMFCIYGIAPTADGLIEYATWCKTLEPKDLAAQEKILQDTIKNFGTSNRSFKITRANDGIQCFIEAIETVKINAVGQVEYVVGTNMDVTAQKQASQYARSLLEASLDPLVTISTTGKILDANEASLKVTGITREKLLDTDFSNYFTEPQKAQEGYQQVFEKGFVADYPLTIKHKNGNLTDVLYNASVYKDDKGNVLGVFAAARDITARKKAEEKIKESELEVRKIKEQLELSITAGKIGVWHWDVKKDLLFWSKEQHEIYGFNKSETVTNSDQFNVLIVSEDLKRIHDDQRAARKLEHEYDFQINRKNDGELRWVKSRAKNTFDSQGVLQYISGVNIDITEQKLFEGKLIEAKTSAENATKSKQQFLSNMSHEIRTPLNSIIGFTNVLMKTELSLSQKEFLEAINTSGKSLNLLVNDILDLAKVDAGKMTFETQPFEIRKSISSILHSFDMKIKEKNLELAVEHDSKVPSVLLGDSLRLHQIFFNLLSNAVKFTHKGNIKLTIKLLNEDNENLTIEFVVSDTGIGIADHKLNSIFNLFEQAELNTSTSYGGTGLGLSIVKQLVEGQGGSISVKSKLGEGSAFSFTLSFGKTNLKLEEEIVLIDRNSGIKTLRVLVAEDVPLNQFLIKIILNDFGFESEIVGNGKLAIEKMQTNAYDIILMDLQMPEMNGYEATEYIRKTLKSHIPIIALTADVTTMDVSKCKEFGMDDYISKPINEDLLCRKIVELVKRQH